MNFSSLRHSLGLFRCGALLFAYTVCAAAPAAPPKPRFHPPPPAELSYSIEAIQKGIALGGQGSMVWRHADGRYETALDIRASLIGKILEEKSEGALDASGLKPAVFVEKRLRKPALTVRFDRPSRQLIFADGRSQPLRGNELDRASVVWQLISLARATPERVRPGMSWSFALAGPNNVENRNFKVVRTEKITTGLGQVETIRIDRVPTRDKPQAFTLWLAPALDWYPAKLRIAESDQEYVEQTLQGIVKK
jgi:Protein of unknown function (DUF3108)